MMEKKFTGNLADLLPAARGERARIEADTRAKVDGRKRRNTERNKWFFASHRRAGRRSNGLR